MTKVSNPKVNITKASASTTQSNAPQRVLIVGQQTGSVYSNLELVENVGNDNTEINNFGKRSHITQIVKAFKKVNEETALDVIVLDDAGSAVDATGTIAFSGTSTEKGSYTVYIGSRKNHKLTVEVASGDTATTVGAALVTAMTADDFLPATGANSTGTVTVTASNGGTVGNNIGLEVQGTVAGLTVTVTGMASGATDPTITSLFDGVANTRYQTIVYPHNYDIAELTTNFLDDRFNTDNKILDGVGIIGKTDTLANLKTYGDARNSQSLVVLGNETVSETFYKGSAMFELDDVIAANFAAVRSLRLTNDANISQFTIASNLDNRGGTHLAALPYFNTPFKNLPLVDTGKGFTETEIGDLNDTGVSVLGNNITNTQIIADQIFTTYKTDSAGNVDLTYEKLNSVDVHSNIAEFFFNNLRADFAQYRLTDGAVVSGYNIANQQTIQSKFIEYYQTLSGAGFLLTRGGKDNVTFFKDNLTFTLDLQNGKVTSIAEVPLVVQLRQMNVTLKAVFNT